MKERIKHLLLIIFAFLYIYYPPIFPTNALHILGVISWIIILKKNTYFLKMMMNCGYHKEILFSSFMIFYLYFIMIINGKMDLLIIYFFITLILEILPISLVISYYIVNNRKKKSLTHLLLSVGILQSIFSVLSFIFPSVQQWFINTILSYGYSDVVISLSRYRMFGISYTLPYSMPIVQAVLTVLSLYLGVNKNKKYLLYTPLLAFSAIVNARISLVIMALGLGFIFFDTIRYSAIKKIRLILIALIFLALSLPILRYIEGSSPITYFWLTDGVDQVVNLIFYGESTGTYTDYITSSGNYILPEGLNLLFGTSERVIRGNANFQSDIGYINDIWLGGIIYSFIVYIYLITKNFKIKRNLNYIGKNGTIISLFLLSVIFLSNIKGTIFKVNEFMNMFFLISIYSSHIINIKEDKYRLKKGDNL